jgi:hypothetical protein
MAGRTTSSSTTMRTDMPVRTAARPALVVAILLVAGCSSTNPAASIDPSMSPSAGEPSGGTALPAGCEPINLNGPNGERIELDGTWVAETHSSNLPETWLIRTQGDCLWGAGAVGSVEQPDVYDSPDMGRLQTIRGKIGTDFVVDGEIVQVGSERFAILPTSPYSPLRLLIEFDDDGTIVLREDRMLGDPGPRCVEATLHCIPVLVLRPADAAAD